MIPNILPRITTAGFDFNLGGLGRSLLLFGRLARERRALGGLDARLLKDVGLDPESAGREAARPFWDLPPGR